MQAPHRRLASWIDAFLDFTEPRKSPRIFRKWAAISALSGVMERKLFIRTPEGELYPNLYIFLVGPPAAGKTVAVSAAESLLSTIEGIHVAPTNLSSASLIDALNESKRTIINLNAPIIEYKSLVIFSGELSTLLPVYDLDFMAKLTNLYDTHRPFKEWKRGGVLRIDIPKPFVTLVGCCTPEYLNNFLPEGAWGQGFMARVIMVFSDESLRKSLFDFDEGVDATKSPGFKDLEHDLKTIFDLLGRMRFTQEAQELIQNWSDANGPPTPAHHKLLFYTARRTTQLLKLSMISSISRSNDLVIAVEDYQTALGWLLEAEAHMPEVFKAMGTGGTDSQAIQDTYHFVLDMYTRTRFKPVSEHYIVHFIQQRVPSHAVMRILELLLKSNMLERSFDEAGRAMYKPTPKMLHDAE